MGMECQLGACSQIGAPCSLKKDYQSLFSKKYPPCPYIPQNATVLSKGTPCMGEEVEGTNNFAYMQILPLFLVFLDKKNNFEFLFFNSCLAHVQKKSYLCAVFRKKNEVWL